MCQKGPLNTNVWTKNNLKPNDFKQFPSVKWTFTQKQIPRQNEKFMLHSAFKVAA